MPQSFCGVDWTMVGHGRDRRKSIRITDLGSHVSFAGAAITAKKLGLRPETIICPTGTKVAIADIACAHWRARRE